MCNGHHTHQLFLFDCVAGSVYVYDFNITTSIPTSIPTSNPTIPTSNPTSYPSDLSSTSSNGGGGLSSLGVVGVVVAALIVILLAVAVVYYKVRTSRQRSTNRNDIQLNNSEVFNTLGNPKNYSAEPPLQFGRGAGGRGGGVGV